jgi:hypothetical protein
MGDAMKTIPTTNGLTLDEVLEQAHGEGVLIVNSSGGRPFAYIQAREAQSFDEEVRALRANPEFMERLSEWEAEALTGRLRTLEEVEATSGILEKLVPVILRRMTDQEAVEIAAEVGIDPKTYGLESPQELLDYWKRCVDDLTNEG